MHVPSRWRRGRPAVGVHCGPVIDVWREGLRPARTLDVNHGADKESGKQTTRRGTLPRARWVGWLLSCRSALMSRPRTWVPTVGVSTTDGGRTWESAPTREQGMIVQPMPAILGVSATDIGRTRRFSPIQERPPRPRQHMCCGRPLCNLGLARPPLEGPPEYEHGYRQRHHHGEDDVCGSGGLAGLQQVAEHDQPSVQDGAQCQVDEVGRR